MSLPHLLVVLLTSLLPLHSCTPLHDALSSSVFLSTGRVAKTDAFVYQAIDCLYLEPENVTLVQNVWAQSSRLGVPQPGPCVLLFQVNGTTPPVNCETGEKDAGFDRPGYDYVSTPSYASAQDCEDACCNASQCAAWVWVPKAPGPYMGCQDTSQPCCYLKTTAPQPTPAPQIPGIVSGAKLSPHVPVVVPPVGMRSAVPLGGVGTGSFELRADGTAHEWTIHNASPAGSAKLGVIEDFTLAVRVAAPGSSQASAAKVLKTGSLGSLAGAPGAEGVDAIVYGGSYPMSRLQIEDADLGIASPALFAYSRFEPGNLNGSATPAVSFTFAATNPSTTDSLDVSLLLALPLSLHNDCFGTTGTASKTLQAASSLACLQACAAQQTSSLCAFWTWDSSSQMCTLEANIPLIAHRQGVSCGVRGSWAVNPTSTAVSLRQSPQPCLQSANPSPLCGDYTLTLSPDANTLASSTSFGTADSLASLWSSFVAGEPLSSSSPSAPLGAGVATMRLAPGQSGTVTLVFAWYLPNRDFMGRTLGAYYSNLFDSSAEAAASVANADAQLSIVNDINAHHSVFAGGSEPDWLADVAINSFSHMRNAMHFADGRWRQWEAFDCDDMDSVHNDFQRHLPYLWAFPEVEVQKSQTWAAFAGADGHINEELSVGCLGPPGGLDQAGGRLMADVTTVWTLGLLELYRFGALERIVHRDGGLPLVQSLWPKVQGALRWQLSQCQNKDAPNLPAYLVCTYDIEQLEKFPTTTYNSFLHLAMMKAVVALAGEVGDNATASAAQAAFGAGVSAVRAQLWSDEMHAFRAYTTGSTFPVMADCLYGASIAHSLGLGLLWNTTDLLSHLSVESELNLDAFGLQVLSGREGPMPFAGIDTTHWGMAGPTFTYVSLAAGSKDVDGALLPTKLFMDNYRSRLADQWNLAGLTTSANWTFSDNDNGQSWCTSHYGMPLTHYYTHYALSGQQTDLPNGKLSFSPVYDAPYTVPLLLAGTLGTVSAAAEGTITVAIKFGTLDLPAGGLVVGGRVCPYAVYLTKGESFSW